MDVSSWKYYSSVIQSSNPFDDGLSSGSLLNLTQKPPKLNLFLCRATSKKGKSMAVAETESSGDCHGSLKFT